MNPFGTKRRRPRPRVTPRSKQTWKSRLYRKAVWRRLAVLGVFLVLVGATTKVAGKPASFIEPSGIASEDVYADFAFDVENLAATESKREAAAADVPLHFRVDEDAVGALLGAYDERVTALKALRPAAAQALEEALRNSHAGETVAQLSRGVLDMMAAKVREAGLEGLDEPEWLAPWLMPAPESLPQRVFEEPGDSAAAGEEAAPEETAGEGERAGERGVVDLKPAAGGLDYTRADWLAGSAREALEHVLRYGVAPPEELMVFSGPLSADLAGREAVVLRDRTVADLPLSTRFPEGALPGLEEAGRLLRERVKQAFTQDAPALGADQQVQDLEAAMAAVADDHVGATLRYDRVTTQSQESAARDAVAPEMRTIEEGKLIQEKGEEWTLESQRIYRAYMEARSRRQRDENVFYHELAANGILVALVLGGLLRALNVFAREQRAVALRNAYVALLLVCGTVVIGRLVYHFEQTGYVTPVAASGILLAILLNTRIAATCAVMATMLLSILYDYSWQVVIVQGTMALTGVFSIYHVRRRGAMSRAAVYAALAGLAAATAVFLGTQQSPLDELPLLGQAMLRVGLSGLACLFLVPGLLPSLERLFGITTDIQLLEYSDLNNEVLSRMAIEVPATYAHSLMLGQLAEAACQAIGANGLLARVCAYYHDIGKLRRPEYFTENQSGTNVHDGLTPRMSARAIAAHVNEGAEMAREYHLPKPLIDAIFEHHGTCKVSFFYEQALAQQKHGGLREEDFRYPGPKPQSREMAVLMICDACESAVRSLKNPNEERVRELIEKIIDARAEDGQFDECDITLKELDTIAQVVTKRVLSGTHRRIAYPEKPGELEEEAAEAAAAPRAAGAPAP